mgnify:FL=1
MPKSHYRNGRKDHNKRVREHRIASQVALLEAGRKIIADQLKRLEPQHEPLIPYVEDSING